MIPIGSSFVLNKYSKFYKTMKGKILCDLLISSFSLYFGCSFALSLFDPIVKINVNNVEPIYKDIMIQNNLKSEYLLFNKGL